MNNLSQLRHGLNQLAADATRFDEKRGKDVKPLFDKALFRNDTRHAVSCVKEAQATLESLIVGQRNATLTKESAEYLTERLLLQINALYRTLASVPAKIDQQEVANTNQHKTLDDLYRDKIQHQEWLRRLNQLVADKQVALEQSDYLTRSPAQEALNVAEQRLQRCQIALANIEQLITQKEKQQ
ncbi:primosomal replication protein [Vibrio tritonius]|uniref:Primosomal replication protein n=1 Tax=Vibrio tritonius TaxID=1435069 RepID=A0ABS7YM20_9VIBR|nr:primosomal replication protein PriC [Vibrio tritonius]MCA2015921.1 primosomal replication protein [Vibrio tritonius]